MSPTGRTKSRTRLLGGLAAFAIESLVVGLIGLAAYLLAMLVIAIV